QYLGLGTVVTRAHPQPGVDQTSVKLTGESSGSAGDQYIGLDRFGRIVDDRWTTSGGTASDRFAYGYDRDGNRLYKENQLDPTQSELFAYDGLNQLTSFARGTLNGTKDGIVGTPSRSQAWDFDALGNFDSQTTGVTTQTRTHNKQNEITSVSGATTPTYDANGDMTGDETGRAFKYDAWNRLVEVRDSDPGHTLLATYRFDGLNRRAQEVRGGTTTDLYYSSDWQVLEERVGGAVNSSYVWSPVYVDALVLRDRDTDGNNSLDERLYAIQDANWNVTALLDPSGNVVERYAYDPYGTQTVTDGSWNTRTSSSYNWTYGFQGRPYDAAAGGYNFRNREEDPILGRWGRNDPLHFKGRDVNLYRNESNSPLVNLDPGGLFTLGIGISGSFQIANGSLGFNFQITLGIGRGGFGVSLTGGTMNSTIGIGLGAGLSVYLCASTADTVDSLLGRSWSLGGYGGPFGGSFFFGDEPNGSGYYGVLIGVGIGGGAGGFAANDDSWLIWGGTVPWDANLNPPPPPNYRGGPGYSPPIQYPSVPGLGGASRMP
ncbi:MAG: hypothetical protein J2P46_13340, partial [Zavarzinella sp.]|nr:hypothetical protein [Zavarzinella sp.]